MEIVDISSYVAQHIVLFVTLALLASGYQKRLRIKRQAEIVHLISDLSRYKFLHKLFYVQRSDLFRKSALDMRIEGFKSRYCFLVRCCFEFIVLLVEILALGLSRTINFCVEERLIIIIDSIFDEEMIHGYLICFTTYVHLLELTNMFLSEGFKFEQSFMDFSEDAETACTYNHHIFFVD